MTSLRWFALAALLAAGVSRAGEQDRRLSAPPTVDPSPTGYACTVETLASGAGCVFEGDPLPTPAGGPRWTMADVGGQLCAAAARAQGEARPDAGVKAWCEAEVLKGIRRCA